MKLTMEHEGFLRKLKDNGGFLPGECPYPELIDGGYVEVTERTVPGHPPTSNRRGSGKVSGHELTKLGQLGAG